MMGQLNYSILVLFLILVMGCKKNVQSNQSIEAVNFLVILMDDLGYTDLSCYGSEIKTPNIDKLSQEGILATSFYAMPTCSPTRASLLTGVVSHQNGFGTMAGDWAANQKGRKGYEAFLNYDVVTLPKLLQENGYHTSISGKWHLAYPTTVKEQWPFSRGFDRSFCLMQGGASHFGDMVPLLPMTKRAHYIEDDQDVTKLPKDFYSSTDFVKKSKSYIRESKEKNKPFFHYLAFSAPHWPLQVPDDEINTYKGIYDKGYGKIAVERFKRAQQLGIIDTIFSMPQWPPNARQWDELDEETKMTEAKKMEVYAAMIFLMDKEIGALVDFLKEEGLYDNTFIVLMSDNGAEGNSIMGYEGTGDWITNTFDNSLENVGRQNSYVQLGPAWAHVASLPFKWYKAFSHEGGVRVPAIIRYPKNSTASGAIDTQILSVLDIAPTILEMSGAKQSDSIYQGRKIAPMAGTSWVDYLEGNTATVHKENEPRVWELFGRIGIRLGDWKAIKVEPPYGTNQWELYHLEDDISEAHNLAQNHPNKLKELVAHWEAYVKEKHVVLPDKPTAYAKETYWKTKK